MHFDEYTGRLFSSLPTGSKPESEQEPAAATEFGVKVEIDEAVYKKIMHWIDKAPGEVSGLGKVVHDTETNVLRVVDAMLLPQKNTGVSTEIDGQAIAKAMFLTKDSPGTLRWWWHSHVNMDVFWSGTDVATIKQLGGGGWFLSTVFNKKREMKSAYCQVAPIRMIVDDLETDIMEVVDTDLAKQWDAEYDKNCTVVTPSYLVKDDDDKSDRPWYLKSAEEMNDQEVKEYRQAFGDSIPPELADIFPREEDEDEEDEVIEYMKAQGYVFDEDEEKEADEDEKLDLGSKRHRR